MPRAYWRLLAASVDYSLHCGLCALRVRACRAWARGAPLIQRHQCGYERCEWSTPKDIPEPRRDSIGAGRDRDFAFPHSSVWFLPSDGRQVLRLPKSRQRHGRRKHSVARMKSTCCASKKQSDGPKPRRRLNTIGRWPSSPCSIVVFVAGLIIGTSLGLKTRREYASQSRVPDEGDANSEADSAGGSKDV